MRYYYGYDRLRDHYRHHNGFDYYWHDHWHY
jgi:hypothetical protein